jgi:pyruvate-formate lyase
VVSRHLPVRILDGELIVGAQFSTSLSRCLTEKEGKEWEKLEKKWFRKNLFLNAVGIGNCGAIPGHLIPNYPKALKLGLSGLSDYFESLKAKAGSKEHQDFLDSLIISCRAVKNLAEKYATEAEKLAAEEKNAARKSELQSIAKIMSKVPWQPAENFWEAVQALWFIHMLVMAAESYPGPGLSPGRVDQYLYPYFKGDIAGGKLTREFAKEILRCWFIKHNYAYDFMARTGSNQGINSGFGQLITLGGHGPDGEDISNELTLLLFEVIEEMNMLEPKPNIRIHANTPEPLLAKVSEMIADTQGSPFLMNFDTISEKALCNAGYPEDRLWDYAPVGCLENTLQGCERSGTVDANLNFAKAIELAFFNGRDQKLKIRLGPRTGRPGKFKNFSQFFLA